MRLSTAVHLKNEILAALPTFETRDGSPLPKLAVGLAPSQREGDYKIAVRARSERAMTTGVRRYLQRTTQGELDFRMTGPLTPCAAPLSIGMATAHVRGRLGTLGCFARRNSDDRIGFISNNHVIAGEDAGVDGDAVLHVASDESQRTIGRLDGSYPRLRGASQVVDCAFAYLAEGVDFQPAVAGDAEPLSHMPVAPDVRLTVLKVGNTTGRTEGRITAFNLTDLVVNYSFGAVHFQEQIEIESLSTSPFSAHGDSGSLIVTADRRAVGLLFAGSAIGGSTNAGLTYANPAGTVFDILGVTLLT